MSEPLRGFETYGVVFAGKSGNQAYGSCPFCGKENKFYANVNNLLWDCKRCGKKGNFSAFLNAVYESAVEDLTEFRLKKLSIDRKLPIKALALWKFGMCGNKYILPIRNEKGFIQDLRSYTLGSKMKGTAGCAVGLLGIENLIKAPAEYPVYLCEGEWDAIAFSWLLKFLDTNAVVVGVPGANTFKAEWIPFFAKRNVYVCYDNDLAGRQGELILQNRLTGTAKSLQYLHWPIEFPEGYDIRDIISERAIKLKKPNLTYVNIRSYFKSNPRDIKIEETSLALTQDISHKPLVKITIQEVFTTFKKWLFIKDFRGIQISLATLVSNEMEGDPLWMFLVSSPGGSKTEILQSCSKCPSTYVTSSLTSHSLISGSSFIQGRDPSLLPQLHGKTLVIKDFTTILTKREQEKEEIFGILRDVYDGSSSKVFGNGIKREYISHFSILAAVTPRIHELSVEHQGFGERFLKFSLGDNLYHPYEESMIHRSIKNVGFEISMRAELADIVSKFIAYQNCLVKKFNPKMPSNIEDKLINLSMLGARMRGNVSRDKYRSDIMTSKPAAEYGTRLAKQFTKLMKSLAYLEERREINENDYNIAKKVMLDTISQRTEDVLRMLYLNTPTINDTLKTREVAAKTKYTMSTTSHILADLDILGIVVKTGKLNVYEWTISEHLRELIHKAEIYKDESINK